ncbi:hypothetical protein EYC84_004560 [Monilinia fructicola]|uniref:LITAF domain-containing protein n=1 Tax=Monilinia fructicola TaxID=38448 RepID=A0A5M9K1J4_MONFR|nr:hypothetical protein EYC84_004560 [Monilinia fructicola]
MSVYNNHNDNQSTSPYHEGVSPVVHASDTVSPQSTGITSYTPTPISPQITGITDSSTSNTQQQSHPQSQSQLQPQPQPQLQPHQDLPPQIQKSREKIKPEPYEGIEVVSHNIDTMASQQIPPQQEGFTNEKDQQAPQYQSPPPGQEQYQAPPPAQEQYPPQGHYAPQPPPRANINQGKNNYATAMPIRSLQSGPTPVDCPVCGVREVTSVEHHSGMTTHLIALLCCAVTCLGCIPYLVSGLKDVEQKCGHCGALLAIWHRSGRTEVRVPGA